MLSQNDRVLTFAYLAHAHPEAPERNKALSKSAAADLAKALDTSYYGDHFGDKATVSRDIENLFTQLSPVEKHSCMPAATKDEKRPDVSRKVFHPILYPETTNSVCLL